MPKPDGKPFVISKRLVWEAWLRVKANKGAAGVDEESIAEFERDLKGNLYKLWNRMSSGSYMPPPVRAVEIPKKGGRGVRVLGVPTVADRVAQTVARLYLEPEVELVFHPDSYGYRPGRSAHDALRVCRQRCWRYDWVLDLDLKSFFDSLDHSLVLRSVAHHTDLRWVLLYVERWLKAPLQREDGTLQARDRGSPQGSAISPVLANIFLHYALDLWLVREFPEVPFERYADDAILHCRSEQQARVVLGAIVGRLAQVGLGRRVRQFLPGRRRRRRKGDPHHDQALAAAPVERRDPHRHCAVDQPDRARLVQLLRLLLPVGAGLVPLPDRRVPRSMGHAETQATAPSPPAGAEVPGWRRKTRARPVRPLARGGAAPGWMMGAR